MRELGVPIMNSSNNFRGNLEWNLSAQYLKWHGAPHGIIPMASGEHDFQPPRGLFTQTIAAFDKRSSAYGPLEGLPEVRQEIARNKSRRHDVQISADYVHLVPTVSVGLALVTNALITRDAHVVFLGAPVYYAIATPALSITSDYSIVDVFDPMWRIELNSVVRDATSVLYMSNPHSPTGTIFSFDDLLFISQLCEKHDVTIISDDVYECMPLHAKYVPIYAVSQYCKDRSIVFSSYAKCYNVCGVSASFCICHPSVFIDICRFFGGPVFMCNLSSQLVIADCLKNDWWIEELNIRLIEALAHILPHFESHPNIDVVRPDAGMFLWCRPACATGSSASDVFGSIGVEVMCGSQFQGSSPEHCRLNFGTYPEVLDELARRMKWS